jgi:RHS repeat-associated protein
LLTALIVLATNLLITPAQAQITFRAAGAQVAGTGASITPVIPAGTQAGDLAILIVAGRPSDTSQPAAPAGWTLRSSSLREAGANDLRVMTFYRVLTATNTNPTVTLPANWQGNARGASAQIAVWRGVSTTTPFDTADITGNAAAATWTPPTITTVTAGAWVVSLVASADDNALALSTAQSFTARISGANYDTTTGGDHAIALADKAQATAGAVIQPTWSQTVNGTDPWAGITFALRPNAVPTVALTSPANNAVFAPGATIALAATATDDGSITQVQFFNGATLIGTDTTAPYTFDWASVPAGTYTVTARATDNLGVVTTSNPITINVTNAPTVTLTAPANNAAFVTGSTIPLAATANDDGTITQVQFFNGATLLGSAATAPYTFNWASVAAGSYSITAKATDNLGVVTTSSAITINVTNAPTVTLTSPANNAVFTAPGSINLAATAADDGAITQVQFFNGATLIGAATTAPYTFNWASVPAGSYTITAKATDNLGVVTTSSAITVNVTGAPTVTLTSPANNATFSAPANVPLTATASDDGSVAQVQFFIGATLIATQTAAPYGATLTGVPAGNYTLTAQATDNLGVVTTSAPVAISVQAAAPTGMFFIHPDHLNTPRLITDAAGAPVWRWDNDDPFGNNSPNQNPNGAGNFTCNLRLPGQYFDRETNLNYNYFRDYDPSIGRYVQSDPIGLLGGVNTYGYVDGDPINASDPLGLMGNGSGAVQTGGTVRPPTPPGVPMACPLRPPIGNPNWQPYPGQSRVYHCGFQCFLENKKPSPASPQGECCYDPRNNLVDECHKYSGCRGTPNDYPSLSFEHLGPFGSDRGGIWQNGKSAAETSRQYERDYPRIPGLGR